MSGTSYITDAIPGQSFEQITVSTTAVGFTASKILSHVSGGAHKRAERVYITIETSDLRVRFDGVAPTSTVGHKIIANTGFTIEGAQDITNFKMIRDTTASSDAIVTVTYYFNL